MLAFALRGVVLVVVLGWYSTSVWKMIDGYFKDRFDKYLKEEYAKNPRMKADIESHTRVKVQLSDVAGTREIPQFCQLDTCPIDNADSPGANEIPQHDGNDNFQDQGRSSARADENPVDSSTDVIEETVRKGGKIDSSTSSPRPTDERQRKITKVKRKMSTLEAPRKKKKVKTIMLTEEDFEEAKGKINIKDYDFSEFEYEEASPMGIPIEKLGFKPRADIGNLDTVTEEEYCPMSLDYKGDCSETKKWP